MSRLTLLVFLVALTAISIVHSRGRRWKPCQKRVGPNPRRGGWGGKCFKKWETLYDSPKCDSLIYDRSVSGCPKRRHACCVTDCSKQTTACDNRYKKSYGKNNCNCINEYRMGEVRPESGCKCCKICKRKKRCRRTRHYDTHCFTKNDPTYNETWCKNHTDYQIRRRACTGWGCWCCRWPRTG